MTDAPGPVIDGPGGPDAAIDGGVQPATRATTLAITDFRVLGPEAAGFGGVRGGVVNLSFTDLTMGGGTVVFGTSPIGGCVVTEFGTGTGGEPPPPSPALDAGPVTITNEPAAETPATGLLKTVGPCTFVAAANQYLCVSHTSAGTSVTATNPMANLMAYTFTTEVFPAGGMVGSSLRINGFADATYNSGASAFPIVSQAGTNTLIVARPGATGLAMEVGVTASFTALNGVSPVPGAGAAANFLGDGSIRVTKAADPDWGAIDTIVGLVGEGTPGFTLDGGSDDPANIPSTAADLNFSCDNDTPANTGDDTCGDTMGSTLFATIISGRATLKSTAGLLPFQMPTEIPGTDNWMEWQCAYLLSKSADFPTAALQAILDFSPTRVEMRVLYVAGAIFNGPTPGDVMTGRILAGHGLVGHTDNP